MANKQYDPDLVDAIFGVLPIDGFGEDDVIEVTYDEAFFTIKKGVKSGTITRSKNKNVTAEIKIILQASSRANAALSAIFALDMAKDGGAGVSTFTIRDRNGTSLFLAGEAWIETPAAPAHGKESKERTWTWRGTDLTIFEGGT